ncbi:hypothetical protein BDQ12DRAFT_739274 [Crucibulum laeve]|uniref:Uncharacterized protein n=1 Tax=Crucibulum laeve TaxID=68775 RepID=A0A5C3LK61_9AGAR|nr:hypothetical protein BDQ12DRAFT_739274 [Crucibulum laeve]
MYRTSSLPSLRKMDSSSGMLHAEEEPIPCSMGFVSLQHRPRRQSRNTWQWDEEGREDTEQLSEAYIESKSVDTAVPDNPQKRENIKKYEHTESSAVQQPIDQRKTEGTRLDTIDHEGEEGAEECQESTNGQSEGTEHSLKGKPIKRRLRYLRKLIR